MTPSEDRRSTIYGNDSTIRKLPEIENDSTIREWREYKIEYFHIIIIIFLIFNTDLLEFQISLLYIKNMSNYC